MVVCFAAIFISIKIRYAANDKKIENTPPEYLEDYYYYNQLTYKEQLLFKNIKSAAESFESESEILPYKYTEKEFQRVAKAVTFDCPMLFYLNQNSFQLFCDGYKTSVSMKYNDTASNFSEMQMEIEAVSAAAMAYIKDAETDFEKAVILHDFLTSYCTYAGKKDTENNPNKTSHTAYGALVEKYAFCDGYASAYKILLNRCGVECIIAEGATDVQPHLWNVVKQGDKYYHIDCTWNDSDVDFVSELNFHGFFNLSDKEITKTHRFYTDFSLPVCDSEDNYYSQIDAKVSSIDNLEETAYIQIQNAVSKKKPYFELYLTYPDSPEVQEEAILTAIDRVNGEHEASVLSRSYRIFSATQNGRAITVQIYYINKR